MQEPMDIQDILLDGTRAEIEKVVCPECGGAIYYRFSADTSCGGSFEYRCTVCGSGGRGHGYEFTPNCVEYFGEEYVILRRASANDLRKRTEPVEK